MAQSMICCPLCSSESFSSNNNLCLALINAASKCLRCSLCDEEIRGLDKLTVHLLGHLIYTDEFRKLLDAESDHKTKRFCINEYPEPLNLVKSKQNTNNTTTNNEPVDTELPYCGLLDSLQLEQSTIKIDDEVMIVFNHPSSNKSQENNENIEMIESLENNGMADNDIPKFTISFKTDDAIIKNNHSSMDNTNLISALESNHHSEVPTASAKTSTDLPVNNHKEERENLSFAGKGPSSNSSQDATNSSQDATNSNHTLSKDLYESNSIPDLQKLTLNKSSYLSPSGERVLGYRCDICSLVFPDEQILNMHRQLIHVEVSGDPKTDKSYRCHLCSKSFAMKGSLMVHMRVAHFGGAVVAKLVETKQLEADAVSPDSAQFVCSICNKGFKKEQQLAQHEKFHDGKQCDVCLKTFTTRYFLRKHMRLHTGEMPYTCGVCNKSFTFQQSYHKHLLYHSDDKPYTCTECGRAFKELSTLHNHQRIHTGEKPFTCETCGKCFRQRVSYLVHRRIHTGVMPYSCQICGKTFRYKVSERTHRCNAASTSEPTATIQSEPTSTIHFNKDNYLDVATPNGCSVLEHFLEKDNNNLDVWGQKHALSMDNAMEDNHYSEPTDFFSFIMSPSDKMQQLSLSSVEDQGSHKQLQNTETDNIDTESLKQLLDEVVNFT